MVPMADIFNHKAAIVQLSDEYAIEPICFERDHSDEESLVSGLPSRIVQHQTLGGISCIADLSCLLISI